MRGRKRTKIETYDDGLRELGMAIDFARRNGFQNLLSHLEKSRDVSIRHRPQQANGQAKPRARSMDQGDEALWSLNDQGKE